MSDPVTIADIYALFQASRAEADRRAAEADRRLQKLERIAANTSREVAGLTTRWGQFVENLVAPAVIRLFQERGIEVQELYFCGGWRCCRCCRSQIAPSKAGCG